MTRKDYQLIAHSITRTRLAYEAQGKNTEAFSCLVQVLASDLAQENPRFDRDKFFEACLGRKRE